MKALFGLVFALQFSGCATAQISASPESIVDVRRSYEGSERWLRSSSFVTPFFGDSTKRFLSAHALEHVDLVNNPDGTAIAPGKSEGIIAAGTMVRIKRLEYPTAYVMAERVLYTPRTLVWVYLDVAGTPKNAPPYVLVLRPGIKNAQELEQDLEDVLSPRPLTEQLDAFSELVREGIERKKAVMEMPAAALEMAWGTPERKSIAFDASKRKETWWWGKSRSAVLLDGVVTAFKE